MTENAVEYEALASVAEAALRMLRTAMGGCLMGGIFGRARHRGVRHVGRAAAHGRHLGEPRERELDARRERRSPYVRQEVALQAGGGSTFQNVLTGVQVAGIVNDPSPPQARLRPERTPTPTPGLRRPAERQLGDRDDRPDHREPQLRGEHPGAADGEDALLQDARPAALMTAPIPPVGGDFQLPPLDRRRARGGVRRGGGGFGKALAGRARRALGVAGRRRARRRRSRPARRRTSRAS